MSEYLREIAELTRRKQQQLQVADEARSERRQREAEAKAAGYQSAITMLRDMSERADGE